MRFCESKILIKKPGERVINFFITIFIMNNVIYYEEREGESPIHLQTLGQEPKMEGRR